MTAGTAGAIEKKDVKVKKDTRLDLARRAYTHGEKLTCRLASCGIPFAYDPEETTQFYCSKAHAVEAYVAKHPDMFTPDYKDRRDRELAEQAESRARRADAGRARLAELRAAGKIACRSVRGGDPREPSASPVQTKRMLAAAALGPAGTCVTYAGKNASFSGASGTVVGYDRDGAARVSFNGRTLLCSPLNLARVQAVKTKPDKRKER